MSYSKHSSNYDCEKSVHQKLKCIEANIRCNPYDCKNIEKELLCLLLEIERLIKEDIRIDENIYTTVQTILVLLQEVSGVVNNINNNVATILLLVRQILDAINVLISRQCTPITSVPYVITFPGCYKVVNELAFTGPGIAITIATRDVILDGGNFTLSLTGSTAVGVQSNGNFDNVHIRNLNVTSTSTDPTVNTANRSITIVGASNVLIENVHTSYTNRGLTFGTVRNATVINSVFENHLNDGTRGSLGTFITANSTNILIKDSKYLNTNTNEDAGRGLYFQGSAAGRIDNVRVVGCQFHDSLFITLNFSDTNVISGITVEDCNFTISQPDYNGWSLMFVSEAGGLNVRDVTVRNCNFSNPDSSIFYEPVLLVGVTGALLDGLNIVANSVGNFIDRGIINVALIHLGYSISGIIDTEDIPDAQVENVTIKNSTLNGGSSLQAAHQNVGIYIEAFSKNIVIDGVNISQTGSGNLAPPLASILKNKDKKKKRILHVSTLDGEEIFTRKSSKPVKAAVVQKPVAVQKAATAKKAAATKNDAVAKNINAKAPPIPDQRAAAILVDGAVNVVVKNSVISNSGAGNPGTLPGSGIVFSPFLQFQSIPGFIDPPLTIDVPPTARSSIVNCIVSDSTGNGIENAGDANNVEKNSSHDNNGDGILASGFFGYYEGNSTVRNLVNGIDNAGLQNVLFNNNSALNLNNDYINVPTVVVQGSPALAGQNVRPNA